MSDKIFGLSKKELLEIIRNNKREKLTNTNEGESDLPFLSFVLEGVKIIRNDKKLNQEFEEGMKLFLESKTM